MGFEIQDEIAKIAQQLEKERVGFLFGAGMSIDSGGLRAEDISYELVRRAFMARVHGELAPEQEEEVRGITKKYPLEAIADGAWPQLSFQKEELEEFLEETVFPDGSEIHEGHRQLAKIAQGFNIGILFTTNWDILIEKAFSRNVSTVTESSFRKLDRALASGDVAVVHLHGTFGDDPLVCEKDLMDPSRPLFQIFLSELLSKAFVFVGYSLSDPNIRALYHYARDVLARRGELEKNTYVVYPADNDTEKRVATAVWQQRGAKYIPLTAEEFFSELHRQAREVVLVKLARTIQQRLDIKEEKILNEKVNEILNVFPGFGSKEQVLRYLDGITRGGQR